MNTLTIPHLPADMLLPGDAVPYFTQRTPKNPNFSFGSFAGRYIVFCFLGSAADPLGRDAVAALNAHRQLFARQGLYVFAISNDPQDETENRLLMDNGLGVFWDFDCKISRLYGALPKNGSLDGVLPQKRFWLVLDPGLRVMATFPFGAEDSGSAPVISFLETLPPPDTSVEFLIPPPVLVIPRVFEPEMCQRLIQEYEIHGGQETGVMQEKNGKTVAVHNHTFKRRKDYVIEDKELIDATQMRIRRRVVPEILKVHFFKITRMERYIVCCYAAEDEAHFSAHRDNTTRGTAHRRFAVSINLNSEFEGGEVSFPEYGPRGFKPPPGGAVVFSCSLLHAVSKVTAGKRYAFLPFLYDEEAAKIRAANNQFLGEDVSKYQVPEPPQIGQVVANV